MATVCRDAHTFYGYETKEIPHLFNFHCFLQAWQGKWPLPGRKSRRLPSQHHLHHNHQQQQMRRIRGLGWILRDSLSPLMSLRESTDVTVVPAMDHHFPSSSRVSFSFSLRACSRTQERTSASHRRAASSASQWQRTAEQFAARDGDAMRDHLLFTHVRIHAC